VKDPTTRIEDVLKVKDPIARIEDVLKVKDPIAQIEEDHPIHDPRKACDPIVRKEGDSKVGVIRHDVLHNREIVVKNWQNNRKARKGFKRFWLRLALLRVAPASY
jgi:chemotaxis protein histidine kinase CheA